MAVSASPDSAAFCQPIPALPAHAAGRSRRRLILPLICLAALGLSLALDPDRPTMGIELCPMKAASGLPCPGCGITRSMVHCSRGDFPGAFRHHPLGPAMWLAAIIGASSIAWPGRMRSRLHAFWYPRREAFDRAIIGGVVLLMLFGLLRILFIYVPHPAWWVW